MLAINPLLPFFSRFYFFPDLRIGHRAFAEILENSEKAFIPYSFFSCPLFYWAVIMFAFITVQPQERQAWFIFGFSLTFVKIFSIILSPFAFAFERITEGIGEHRADRRDQQRQEQREQENRGYHDRTHPDKWIGKPQAMRDMMEAEYKAVQEAYRRLKK